MKGFRGKFKVGDWVRFYRNGELVIGVIQYIQKDSLTGKPELCTDSGVVEGDASAIMEIRSCPEQETS